MYDPTMRVLTVLELLQSKERVSGKELAQRLEVHPRTVQRYITRLQDLGIPVEADRGLHGAYRLKPGFRLPPLMLSSEEALTIGLGLQALAHLGLRSLNPTALTVQAKLKRVLPIALRDELDGIERAMALDESPHTIPTPFDSINVLMQAASQRRVAQFEYLNHHGEATQRKVEPYGVIHHDFRWYMVGQCLDRLALRTFRIDRVADVQLQESTFDLPTEFDVSTYLHRTLPFVKTPWQVEVWMDLPLGTARKQIPPSRAQLAAEKGGTVLRCGMDDLEWLSSRLLGLKCQLEVRQPRELMEAFKRVSEKASEVRWCGEEGAASAGGFK